LAKALSDKEVYNLVNSTSRLLTHEEISKYPSIEALLGPKQSCIILYVTQVSPGSIFGHWCCVFKAPWQPDTICYFDPYGKPPDVSLNKMSPQAVQEYGNHHYLEDLLTQAIQQGTKVVYNMIPLQTKSPTNAICGRLTGLRLLHKDLNNKQFADLMKSKSSQGIDSNQMAVLLTKNI
jgi:hypothetical protein